jgi:hypothetical protein
LRPSIACALLLLLAAPAFAQTSDSSSSRPHDQAPRVRASRFSGGVRLDGRLDERAWQEATPVTDFTQLDPDEGKPASEQTEVRVLVDESALWIGARFLDREPKLVKARLARRDDASQSDLFDVWIDSYHDHLTAWHFRVNPTGTYCDGSVGASGEEDPSWDPVWSAAAVEDSSGWSTEIRIPLSQLRFNRSDDGVWGIQFARTIFRKGEVDYLSFTPKKEQGGVSRFGHLEGLGRLPVPRRLELLPYSLLRNERLDFPRNHPFRSESDYFGRAGLDLKYGLTSDLTLDATVNPDFGQVEVDPAEVNLTAFETFFAERRTFFVEGADVFNFGQSRALNNYGFLRLFHSRRIGRTPQRIAAGENFGFVDAPEQTTIAGAAKVTGKTKGGWSIGVIDALTADEEAQFVDTLGVRRETTVEPLTHYFAGRVKRDFRDGNTVVGGLFTATHRAFDEDVVENLLRRDAFTGGIDLNHSWKQRSWALDAAVSGTSLRGSPSALAIAQRSSTRYYQRPDHEDYAVYDPTRTKLDGNAFDASIAKVAGKHWQGSIAYVSKSPGYELNDLGFQTRADYRALSNIVYYQENQPGRVLRNWYAFPFWNYAWNYGGDQIFNAYAFDWGGQFKNFWSFDSRYSINLRAIDDRLTRGGPQAQSPQNGSWFVNVSSDSRRSWSVSPGYTHAWNEHGGSGDTYSLGLSFRPSSSLRLRFEPSFSRTHALAQYIAAVRDPDAVDTYGRRYVFSTLDRDVTSLVTRADWTFTPRLSLQLYLQPLVDAGEFSEFKEFRRPRAWGFDIYGRDRGTITPNGEGGYTIDPGNGAAFDLPDPNYNFRSLLGNAVLRWEYRPGSTLFFVWQQRRDDVQPIGDFEFGRDYEAIFKKAPENVYALKATWWVGL